MARLEKGRKYFLCGDVIEVIKVDDMGATVRPITKRSVSFETIGGKTISFDRPANSFLISANSALPPVESLWHSEAENNGDTTC